MPHSSSRRPPRARRPLLGVAATVAALAVLPATAAADPVTWSELDPLGTPQPTQALPAVGTERMLMVAIPGGGWTSGSGEQLARFGALRWWTDLARSKGIAVRVLSHRPGSAPGVVPAQLADLGDALGRIHAENPGVPICLYGASSGGQLATMLQLLRPDITTCVVSDGGPLDVEAFLQNVERPPGLTPGEFFPTPTSADTARGFFTTAAHPDGVSRYSPSTQTSRIGRLFTIEGGANADGSAADRLVGDRHGREIADRIPGRVTARYVHAAADGQASLPTGNSLFLGPLDTEPGGAEADEARLVYTQAADWMLVQAAAQTPARLGPQPFTPAVTVPRLSVSVRTSRVRPDARGRFTVRIRCTGATISCGGLVTATFSSVSTGRIPFRVISGRSSTATVRLTLNARQRALLARRRSVVARVRVTASGGPAKRVTETRNVRLLRRR